MIQRCDRGLAHVKWFKIVEPLSVMSIRGFEFCVNESRTDSRTIVVLKAWWRPGGQRWVVIAEATKIVGM